MLLYIILAIKMYYNITFAVFAQGYSNIGVCMHVLLTGLLVFSAICWYSSAI